MFRSLIFHPALFGNGAVAAAGPLVQDTFTGTNGTLLAAHSPDVDTVGGGWLNTKGNQFDIISNQAKLTVSAVSVQAIDCGVADYTMTCDCTMSAQAVATNQGLAFRVVDANSYFVFGYRELGTLLRLLEFTGGSLTARAASTETVSGTVEMRVDVNGANATAYIDDVQKLTYGSVGNLTETKVGLHAEQTTNFRWDTFEVNSL